MIIDFEKKYIFVGLPFSASSAISKELTEIYNGQTILAKHTNIPSLIKERPDINIKDFYIFAVVRDPIEIVLTKYNKLITNAHEVYTKPEFWIENGGFVSKKARNLYKLATENNWSFEDYVRNVYKVLPYDNDLTLNAPYLTSFIRFNNLAEDFKKCLSEIGIEPVRDLPTYNKTKKVVSDVELDEKLISYVFGPFYNHHKRFFNKNYPVSLGRKLFYDAYRKIRFYKRLRFDTIQNRLNRSHID